MPEQSITLSAHQVRQLQQRGHCAWHRPCDPYEDLPYAVGQVLVGSELGAPARGVSALLLTAVGCWYEQDDAGKWTYHYTLKAHEPHPPAAP